MGTRSALTGPAVTQTVDSLYEGVRRTLMCDRCVGRRPRNRGFGRGDQGRRRVIIAQLSPRGVFHMRLPEADNMLCGRKEPSREG